MLVLQSFKVSGHFSVTLAVGRCGTPNGAEAVAYAARQFIHNIPDDHLQLNLDFKNAFNSLRRDKMLEAVGEATPDLYPFVYSAYAKPSSLFCGNSVLLSEEGVQQGDSLGGSLSDVLHDLQLVDKLGSDLGL